MARSSRRKNIESIEEFIGIVYENQNLFKQLEKTDLLYKKAALSLHAQETEKRLVQNEKYAHTPFLTSYNLELFSLSIPLKRHKIKRSKKKLASEKELSFSIKAEKYNRNTVSLLLHHYKEDDINDVMNYAHEYAHSYLELKPTLWEQIKAFCKALINRIKKILRT